MQLASNYFVYLIFGIVVANNLVYMVYFRWARQHYIGPEFTATI